MTMTQTEIKFHERPTEEILQAYKERLEDLLSDLDVSIEIVMREHPLDFHFTVDGVETEIVRHWIKKLLITTLSVKNFEVRMFSDGIGENWREEAWYEAHNIQGRLYQHLGKIPGRTSEGDPYWKLWDKLKK